MYSPFLIFRYFCLSGNAFCFDSHYVDILRLTYSSFGVLACVSVEPAPPRYTASQHWKLDLSRSLHPNGDLGGFVFKHAISLRT